MHITIARIFLAERTLSHPDILSNINVLLLPDPDWQMGSQCLAKCLNYNIRSPRKNIAFSPPAVTGTLKSN